MLFFRSSVSCLALLSSLAACSPTTGTRLLADRSSLTRFSQLGVAVTKNEDFSIRIAREQEPNPGALIVGISGAAGGLVGALVGTAIAAGIDSAAGQNADSRVAEPFSRDLASYDPVGVLSEGLVTELATEKVFPAVTGLPSDSIPAAHRAGIDGMLTVNIKQWGLRLCAPSANNTKVQAGLLVQSRIVVVATQDILWEREELYMDGECHDLQQLSTQKRSVRTLLSNAIGNLAGKLVNEIRFP